MSASATANIQSDAAGNCFECPLPSLHALQPHSSSLSGRISLKTTHLHRLAKRVRKSLASCLSHDICRFLRRPKYELFELHTVNTYTTEMFLNLCVQFTLIFTQCVMWFRRLIDWLVGYGDPRTKIWDERQYWKCVGFLCTCCQESTKYEDVLCKMLVPRVATYFRIKRPLLIKARADEIMRHCVWFTVTKGACPINTRAVPLDRSTTTFLLGELQRNEWVRYLRRIQKSGALQREHTCPTERRSKNLTQFLGAFLYWTRYRVFLGGFQLTVHHSLR